MPTLLLLATRLFADGGLELTASHDFGRLAPRSPAIHEFTLRNPSASPLHILAVHPSCDCLQVPSLPSQIPARGEVRLAVQATPANPGPVEWTVAVVVEGESCPRLFGLSAWGAGETNAVAEPAPLASARDLADGKPLPPDTLFVDVRSPDQFRLARIPGSLNLPLHTLKTKAFLKPKRTVLVNEGCDASLLLVECGRLRAAGFPRIEVLDGGLLSWQIAGGAVEGERPHAASSLAISAGQYHASRGAQNWLVVRLLPPNGLGDAWFTAPNAPSLVFNPATLPTELAALAANQPPGTRCLLITDGGDFTSEMDQAIASVRNLPVFWLAGGLPAYRDFLARQFHQLDRRQMTLAGATSSRPGSGLSGSGGSGGCGCGRR